MARSQEAITADLDKILGTLSGLRTGFAAAGAAVDIKLGPMAPIVKRTVAQILDVHEAIAIVLRDLEERTRELKVNQDKLVSGIGEAARVLA